MINFKRAYYKPFPLKMSSSLSGSTVSWRWNWFSAQLQHLKPYTSLIGRHASTAHDGKRKPSVWWDNFLEIDWYVNAQLILEFCYEWRSNGIKEDTYFVFLFCLLFGLFLWCLFIVCLQMHWKFDKTDGFCGMFFSVRNGMG